MTKDEIVNYLESMRLDEGTLPDLELGEVSNQIIDYSLVILSGLAVPPHACYTTGRNSVQFEWHLNDQTYIELEIFDDKVVCMIIPQNNPSAALFPSYIKNYPPVDLQELETLSSYLETVIGVYKKMEKSVKKEKIEIEVIEKKTPWYKKPLHLISIIFAAIFFIFAAFTKNLSQLDAEIKEKKKKDKELEKETKKKTAEIQEDAKQSAEMEKKIAQSEQKFSKILESTENEQANINEKKKKVAESAYDTDANIDWVKSRFGGQVIRNE